MTVINAFHGSVCVDCAMVIANGDTSGIEDYEAWAARVEAADATDRGRYSVVMGSEEEDDDAVFFGTRPCDYCGDRLHGNRFPVTFQTTSFYRF